MYNLYISSKVDRIKYINELIKSTELILYNPLMGKPIDKIKAHVLRQIIHKKHRVIYTIIKNNIYILSYIHTSRNFNSKEIRFF